MTIDAGGAPHHNEMRSAWAGLQGVNAATVMPCRCAVMGTIAIPGSKSETNRAVILAASATGVSRLSAMLRSDDSFWCIDALRRLGVDITENDNETLSVVRASGWQTPAQPAFIGSGGTTGRFLTSVLALSTRHPIDLTASAQLSGRPMQPLFQALQTLGGRFVFPENQGSFPVRILPRAPASSIVEMSGRQSSQFISGVLMGAPFLDQAVEIRITDEIVQADYVRITLKLMEMFGVTVDAAPDLSRFTVAPQAYRAADYAIEADASTASYFLALAAVTGGEISLGNLTTRTFQPDIKFIDILKQMGCAVETKGDGITLAGPPRLKGGFSVDMQHCSDTALTLAAIAPFADAPIEITNVAHIRKHESDRIAVMAASLAALGVPCEERPDGLRIQPAMPHHARMATHDDHRVAMSLAVLGAAGQGITLEDPGCVSKTCPDFFELIGQLGVETKLS